MYAWDSGGSVRSEVLGAATGTSRGTALTANASANTKGTYVDIGGATAFDYELLQLFVYQGVVVADFTVDLALSDGANRWIIAQDLRYAASFAGLENSKWILPLHVPKGSQLSARVQCSTGGSAVDILLHGFSQGLMGAPGYSRCEVINAIATSRGVAVDPGGTANTKGTYQQLVASTARDYMALAAFVGNNGDFVHAASQNMLLDIAIGAAAAEVELLKNVALAAAVTQDSWDPRSLGPYPFDIPSGSRLAARSQCSVTTASDRTCDVSVYGFR